MSNFEADARVVVRADTGPFRKDLLKAIEAFEKKPVRIKVVPDFRGFQKELRAGVLAATKNVTAPIKITPDLRGFKTAVRAAVREATRDLPATAGPGRGGGGGGGGGRPRGPAPVFSQTGRRLSGAAAEAKREALARQAEELKVLKVVQAAEVKAHIENMARDKARAAADKKARLDAINAATKAGLVSKTGQPLFGAAADAKAEALAREQEELRALEKIQAAETKAHAENIKRDKARAVADEKARLKVLADLEKAGALSSTGKPLRGAALAAKQEAQLRAGAAAELQAEKNAAEKKAYEANRRFDAKRNAADRAARLATVRAVKLAEEQAVVARPKARVARRALQEAQDFEPTGATATARARSALAKTTESVSTAEKAFTATLGTNDRALQLHTASTLRDARALQVLQAQTLEATIETERLRLAEERAAASAAKRRSFLTRGFGSQLATFAGLRGAVLSANAGFIAGTVAAIAFGKAVQTAASFESELNVFRIVAGATADEMERVSAIAIQLGADISLPGVSAQTAAQAIAQLSKAGLSVEDSIGGVRGVLQLSTAAAIDQAKAVELVASALNAFDLAGTDAVHVADLLTNSANLAQGSIEDVAIALQQSSAVAKQFGVGVEDTITLLTLLQRAGIRGSDAGTSLRVAFTRLTAPTKEAAEVLRQLNVQVLDAEGSLRPEVFADIAEAQKDLTKAQQNANAKIIFGVDALRAYSIISREGRTALDEMRVGIDETGSASELAAARMSGLTGKAEALKNSLNTLGLVIGQSLTPSLESVTSGLTQVVNAFAKAIQKVEEYRDKIQEKIPGDTIFEDILTGNLGDQISAAAKSFQDVQNVIRGDFRTPEQRAADESRERLEKARTEFNNLFASLKSGGFTNIDIHDTLVQLDSLASSLETGDQAAQAYARAIREVRTQLSEGDLQAPFKLPPIDVPDILKGFTASTTAASESLQKLFVAGRPEGLLDPGNLDLLNRKIVDVGNRLATLDAIVVRTGKREFTVIPTIIDGAKKTEAQAKAHFEATGEHLGQFISNSIAKAYVTTLSDHQNLIHATASRVFGTDTASGVAEAFARGIPGEQIFGAGALLIDTFIDGIKSKAEALKAAVASLVEQLLNQLLGLSDEMNKAILSGSRDAQIAVQKQIFATNARIIKIEEERLKGLTSKDPGFATATERVRAARANQVAAQSTIAGIEADAEAETKRKADEIQKARDAADQNILDSFSRKSEDFDARAFQADQTVSLKNDLAVEKARKKFLFSRIAFFRKTIKDADTLRDALRAVRDALRKTDAEISEIEQQIIDDQRENAQKAADAAFEAITKRAELAGLRGNTANQLKFIDKAIANRKAEKKRLQKLGKATLDVELEIEKLIDQRDEVSGKAAEGSKGTTVFDLLSQAADIFKANAGSLIGPDQPFRSTFDFTGDLTNFLRRRDGTTRGGGSTSPKKPDVGITSASTNVTNSFNELSTVVDTAAEKLKQLFVVGKPQGLIKAGNIDLLNRKSTKLPDGSSASVRSFSVPAKEFGRGVGEILLPSIINGRAVSQKAAIAHFRKTGENLGQFRTVADANRYAKALHMQQQRLGETRGGRALQATDARIETLTAAIDRNTEALLGKSSGNQANGAQARAKADRKRYWEAKTTREEVEASSTSGL